MNGEAWYIGQKEIIELHCFIRDAAVHCRRICSIKEPEYRERMQIEDTLMKRAMQLSFLFSIVRKYERKVSAAGLDHLEMENRGGW